MKTIIFFCLRYLLSLIIMVHMYWLFYWIVGLSWAPFAAYLPSWLATIPPIIVWLFLHYLVAFKALKPLKINGYYYLIVNILTLAYTLSVEYFSYCLRLEQHEGDTISTQILHSAFSLKIVLTCVAFILIINTWNKFYRRTKLCKD